MPYVQEENKILTKIRGVSLGNGKEGRQKMLRDMSLNPECVDLIYIKGVDVYAVYDDGLGKPCEWHLGRLKDKYRNLLFNNKATVKSWFITGGHRLFNTIDNSAFMARLGCNLEIELTNI